MEESRRVKELRGSSTACDLPMPQKRPRRKTLFPAGAGASTWLFSSLTTCARRPETSKELRPGIWNYNEVSTGSEATMRFSRFPHGGDASLARGATAFYIEQWWFTSLMASISEALEQYAGERLHYLTGVDGTIQIPPREMPWVVKHPGTRKLAVPWHIGPYAGPAFEHSKLTGAQEAAVRSARNLEWILSTECLLHKLIPRNVPMDQIDTLSGLYIARAGPGTGKTRTRVAGVGKYLTANKPFNMYLAPNTKARDILLHMLHDVLPREDFHACVRVKGHRHLDNPLVRSRILGAISVIFS